ncbi:hypothetical protein AVEN_262896-1 [Araneus ventricosus]|uniref:Integrase catalytic domain-containing protein n=1 Tax=Araneus ventricosus TaxID=182803 RepID=A0A4Y2DI70_ARAVE|nr:hypothetical protein AVEN_262896-1 [Araneus ventricosus]
MGKSQNKVKAPLKLVPVITEVFSKIHIDAVGLLPTLSKGRNYLLNAICMSPKYPDAIPVTDMSSVSVADFLLEIISRMGFSCEVQCDLGTSFTSHLTTELFDHFGFKVTHSSLHHPQSNAVERFHRMIKRILKVLCLESGLDCEKNLPATLLALRTITHESTGVFVYGHWVKLQEADSTVEEYVFELINRMRRCQELAIEKITEVRDKGQSDPLTHVLKSKIKKEKVIWTNDCDQAFKEFKSKLTAMPVLYAPDYKKEFIIKTDASDVGMGIVMSQSDLKNVEHPVLYSSKKFADAQRKYGTTEKEYATIIYAVKKLTSYLKK